jgi:hypothetical protein
MNWKTPLEMPSEVLREPQMEQELLASNGHFLKSVALPPAIREHVTNRNWNALDEAIRAETLSGGSIYERLRDFRTFSEIEFIISIRSSREQDDEDGIWHDDGSRVLAFSLSLTLNHEEIEGGRLEMRRRTSAPDSAVAVIPTPPYGTMIVFATGYEGFEHKICRVIQGERIIIAGWCT